jgi:endoglucanase
MKHAVPDMKLLLRAATLLALSLILLLIAVYLNNSENTSDCKNETLEVQKTWAGFKKFFVLDNGRVQRPKDNFDTVSEGQAYAMLRAVLLDDKDTFDACYRWTEHTLSRVSKGDYLLAWLWKNGAVADWMPAADADIDYALTLLLADKKWGNNAPADLTPYLARAHASITAIKKHFVVEIDTQYYLLPWLSQQSSFPLPLNISYYSPAHFRLFYELTGDKIWMELVHSSYKVLFNLLGTYNNSPGAGLVPDWAMMLSENEFAHLDGKTDRYAWESIRVPFRFFLDYYWFNSSEAKKYFQDHFCPFLKREIDVRGLLYSEYTYEGEPAVSYENSAFYSTAELASFVCDNMHEEFFVQKRKNFLNSIDNVWVYEKPEDYYRNSLAWLPAALKSGFLDITTFTDNSPDKKKQRESPVFR